MLLRSRGQDGAGAGEVELDDQAFRAVTTVSASVLVAHLATAMFVESSTTRYSCGSGDPVRGVYMPAGTVIFLYAIRSG